jgi:hypothetical protein
MLKGKKAIQKDNKPEGSFKCESVARSSAVSNKGGLRSGGRPSLLSLISLLLVLIVISCAEMSTYGRNQLKKRTLPRSSTKTTLMLSSLPLVTETTSAEIQA